MGDVDERLVRSGSQSRFPPADLPPPNFSDPLAKIISEVEHVQGLSDKDLIDLLRKIENHGPERCTKAPKFVSQMLTHKNSTIRKSAYVSALAILGSPQNPRDMLLDAYRLALCSPNCLVAQHAISLLPEFVDTCPEEANNLIKFGSIAYNKLPAPTTDAEMHLSRALTKASQ